MGIIIEFLILLGLIKYMWGQETADGCLSSCVSNIVILVLGAIGFILIQSYLPGLVPALPYILGGIIVYCIVMIVYSLICAFRQ